MSRVCYFFAVFLFSGVLYGNADGLEQAQNNYRTFWYPMYPNGRLDYCTRDDQTCGKPVANRYCQMMGYQRADEEVIDYNVGKTYDLSSSKRCRGWHCNGFMKIRCVSSLRHQPVAEYYYREKQFDCPMFNQSRVAWCYDNSTGCGRRAAHSFCRRMGYARSTRYVIEHQVTETRALGNHRLCLGGTCDAFKRITCYR